MEDKNTPVEQQPEAPENQPRKTPLAIRILALLGAIAMIILVLLYTYSVATGKIMEW